ncbi:MAG: hypothetical protein M3N21_04655 [Actinomycetota bacterium]|nr:hypothetical protein [Actinomycetota bacterium]
MGVLYLEGADRLAASVGISGLQTGDTKAQAQAVMAELNKQGGLGGRQIQPFYYGIKAADSANDPTAAQQAGCVSLTQDSRVQVVVSILNIQPSTLACFAKAHTPVLDDIAGLPTVSRDLQAFFFAPGDFSGRRLITNVVDGLWRTGWLTPRSTVGSFTYNTPEDLALVETALKPALRLHGLTIAVQVATSNGADGVNQADAAVLKYRAANVDRVIPVLASPLFLMEGASSQAYHPKFAVYSTFGPGALLETAAPRDELQGAAGIGWQPYLDIGSGTHPGPVSTNETRCFAIMAAAGEQTSSATAKGLQTNLCDVLFYLQAAAAALGGFDPQALSAAGARIGATFPAADTFRTDVSQRSDGAAGYRDLVYSAICSCFQYVGPVRVAP